MERVFGTPEPIHLYVEIGRGQVTVDAGESSQSTVEVTGERADEVEVEQDGRTISVIGPRLRSGFRREPSLNVTATIPRYSQLVVRTGSADIAASGTFGRTELKSGSGEVEVEEVEASAAIETGSGGIAIGRLADDARIKSGSGDVRVGVADADVSATTGSGDVVVHRLNRGKFSVKSGSGDVAVGIPSGMPVWTDITTSSGSLRSDVASTGAPGEGQDFVELRLKTSSGDITLKQL
jgi:DUF4097 and DUF4098 domain-containing protein YvlB